MEILILKLFNIYFKGKERNIKYIFFKYIKTNINNLYIKTPPNALY